MLDQGDMITHLTLCCAENWHQLYSYSVPSLSLLSSHIVSDADFTFFFSKFLRPVNITTSVKSSELYNYISQFLKGLSESGLLFSECTRCWLWCEEHLQFLILQHLALPPLSQLITSSVFLLQLSVELRCKLDLLYWFKVYSHSLLLSIGGLFLTQSSAAAQHGASRGRAVLLKLALSSQLVSDVIMLKTTGLFMFSLLVTLASSWSPSVDWYMLRINLYRLPEHL